MDHVFAVGNLAALAGWAALLACLAFPKAQRWFLGLSGLILPLLFAIAYIGLLATAHADKGGFGSIGQVRDLFANDAALTAGWFHYLAFDLFVGAFIVRDGLARGVARLALVPCLALTFLFGPAGFLLYAMARLALGRRPAPALA